MKKRNWAVLIYFAPLLLMSCGKRDAVLSNSGPEKISPALQHLERISDFEKLVIVTMRTNEVIKVLGPPRSVEKDDNDEFWRYSVAPFPAGQEMPGSYVIGVTLGFTNGQLASIGYSYLESRYTQTKAFVPSAQVSATDTNVSKIEVYIVNKDSIAGGKLIDTPIFPHLGFIPPIPVLTITNVKSITISEQTGGTTETQRDAIPAFGIILSGTDSQTLAEVTRTNLSKKILI